MAKLSQNISNLVFRRNIPYKLETYVLNCDMLQVLVEMDGIKNVAAIAANLNKPVGELVTTFATLYQQKLIFLIKPNPTFVAQPEKSETVSTRFSPNGHNKPGIPSMRTQRNRLVGSYAGREVNENKTPAFNSRRNNSKTVSQPPAQHAPARHDDRRRMLAILKNSADSGAATVKFTGPNNHKDASFRVSRSERVASGNVSEAELPIGRTKPVSNRQKSVPLPKYEQADEYPTEKAIEYFEKGLAYLQRRSYKEALHQFQIALKLDPDNRLCRANIQRIKKVLQSNGYVNFKKPQ